jgi:hypothetical protein
VQDDNPSDYKKVKKNFGDYKWTPLNASLTEVLMEIKKVPTYQMPKPIPGILPTQLAHKFCAFHDSYGHLTEQCVSLRQLIEKFIENGKLIRFLIDERNQQRQKHGQALRPRK